MAKHHPTPLMIYRFQILIISGKSSSSLCIVGCPPSPGMEPSAADKDALDRYMRAWSRGNLTIMETVLDQSFTFTMTGQGEPIIIMRNGFTNFFKQFMKTIEDGGGPTVTYTSPLMTFTNVIRRQVTNFLNEELGTSSDIFRLFQHLWKVQCLKFLGTRMVIMW